MQIHYLENQSGGLVQCSVCAAIVPKRGDLGTEMHTRFHETFASREEARAMSSTVWCDRGNHPFSGKEERESGEVRVMRKNEHGQMVTVTETIDACKAHSFQSVDTSTLSILPGE